MKRILNMFSKCEYFIDENIGILTKWDIVNIGQEDFFICGDKRAWKKRALKAKLIKRALKNIGVSNQAHVDLSQETMEEDHHDEQE